MRKLFPLLAIISLLFFSCKKEVTSPESEIDNSSVERTSEQLLKDSIYYYYKLYSLWEKSIPKYEVISSFTDTIKTSERVLDVLKSKTPYFAGYSGPYDRFSYFTTLDTDGGTNARLKMDESDGYGLFFSIGAIDEEVAYPIVHFVEGGSAASIAGLERSDIVLELNSVDMKIAVSCNQQGCKASDPIKFNGIIDKLKESLESTSMSIKVKKNNNLIKTYQLTNGTYEINPLTLDTVFEFPNKNIGYFVYSSFEQISNNGVGFTNKVLLDNLFDHFSSKNIKSLIVDLRYNSGGYVDAATYMANKIIGATGDKKLMLKYELNEYLSKTSSNTFKEVFFNRENNLDLETVCFIVSERTASASEMLINVLQPYMNVKIVAETDRTYGKPVGFFEQKVMNKISLWVTSFKLLNANNVTDYWLGLEADSKNVDDYIFSNFGDKDERMIAAALKLTGAITPSTLRAQSRSLDLFGKKRIIGVNDVDHKGALK